MTFWFDPMVNTVGMPNNPGPAGNNLAATQAMNNQLTAQRNYVAAQQPSQAQLYGGGGFGAQPAAYAAAGASYGRATGGFAGAPGRVGTISNPGTSNPGYLSALTRSYTPQAPAASAAWNRTLFNPAAMGPAQSFSPSYSPLPTNRFVAPQAPAPNFNDLWSNRGAPAMSPSAISAQQLQMWNRGLPAQGGFGLPGSGNMSLPRVQIHTGTPQMPTRGATMPSFDSAARAITAQRNFTQPADFNTRFNALLPRVNPGPSNYFDSITQAAREQPFLNAYNRGTIAPAGAGGGWDFGGRARGTPAMPVPMPQPRPAMGDMFANRFSAAFPASGQAAPVGAASFASRYAPFASTAGTSPLARGLTSPSASFNDRFSALSMGVGQPTWSPGGITMADRLRQMQPSQPAPAPDFASRYGAFQPPNWNAGTLSRADLAIPHAYPVGVRR